MNKTICGVDVSKEWLDAHVEPSGAADRFRNDAAGIADLAAWCQGHGVELVVMEASGGYERLAFLLLWELGVCCSMANARSVRYFAEAMGFLEKTDRIDAAVIARYGAVKQLEPMPPPSAAQQRLKALVARLSQVGSDLTIQKQRKSAAVDDETIASLDEVIALLVRQSRRLEGEIASLIDDDPLWACLDRAFRSLKGVASRTVARLMAQLPEIGIVSNRAIAKPAWLRSPMTVASAAVEDRCAAVARGREVFSSSLQASSPNTIHTWLPSSKGCRLPERKRWLSASHSQGSCLSFSMQKHAMRATSSQMQLDNSDSRSLPCRAFLPV